MITKSYNLWNHALIPQMSQSASMSQGPPIQSNTTVNITSTNPMMAKNGFAANTIYKINQRARIDMFQVSKMEQESQVFHVASF